MTAAGRGGGARRPAARGGLALAMSLAIAACTRSAEPASGIGRLAFAGPVRSLSPSPDGSQLAFLDGCTEVRGQLLPPQTASCDLRVVPSSGGGARKIATGVSTLPHGLAWSPDGKTLAALAEYDYAGASGTLVLLRGGGERALASGVTFHGFGAHGELGLVAGGRLSVLLPEDASPRAIAGAEGIASFDLSTAAFGSCEGPEGDLVRLLARRSYGVGGQLLAAGCRLREARPLERGQVGDYAFSPAGAQLAYTVNGKEGAELRVAEARGPTGGRVVARGAQSFAFAPSGPALALVAGATPGKQGDLLIVLPGRPASPLAREVGELRWAAGAPLLAWLERYDPRVRSGTLGAGGPGLATRTLGANVSDFEVSSDGRHLAFLQHTTRGGYSVDLYLARADAPKEAKPEPVARGVFGFAFSPDARWLYYRTRCVRNAEACDLERVPAAGLAAGAKPEAIAPGVKSFEFDPRDPDRLIVTWQRMDMVALDVGVWAGGKLTSVDTRVLPGSASFLGPDSRRIAYAVVDRKRQGVYVAEVPR